MAISTVLALTLCRSPGALSKRRTLPLLPFHCVCARAVSEQQRKANTLLAGSLQRMADGVQFRSEFFVPGESIRMSLDFLSQQPECGKPCRRVVPLHVFTAHVVVKAESRQWNHSVLRGDLIELQAASSNFVSACECVDFADGLFKVGVNGRVTSDIHHAAD